MRAPMVVFLGLAILGGDGLRAEVRATNTGSAVGAAVLCDCPLTSPLVWQPLVTPASSQMLNPSGASNGDLAPAFAIGSGTGTPIAVWPEWDGNDFELMLSMFDGLAWSQKERLTENTVDDTEPAVTSREDGSTAIVWRAGLPIARIQYRQRQSTGAWSPIIDVTDGTLSASNPVVIAGGSRIRVAYIEAGGGGSKIVKVAGGWIDPDPWPSVFEPEIIAITYWNGELEPGLHSAPGGPISIWTDSQTTVGFSRFNGVSWTTPQFEPYYGEADLERARIRAKQRAHQGP